MPHIHTEPGHHDFTVSAYIIRIDGPEPKILLHRHKLLGVYMQFGGHVELHENPWQSLTHEISEESGYELSQLEILQPKIRLSKLTGSVVHPQPVSQNTHLFGAGKVKHFHIDSAYAFTTKEPPLNKVAQGESSELKLFTLGELKNLSAQDIFENIYEQTEFIITTCLKEWVAIPATEV